MAVTRYETALSHDFRSLANEKKIEEAKTAMAKLNFLERRKGNLSIASIVTTQVSSCTFAAMTDRNERYAVVMHLDASTPVNAAGVRDILQQSGVHDVRLEHLFISRVDGEEEREKEDKIFKVLGLEQYGIPVLHQTRLQRGDPSEFFAMQHQLIGVDFLSGKATIHGSQGELVLPGAGQAPGIQTGAQKALMSLSCNIVHNSYDTFCSAPFLLPFSTAMSETIRCKFNRSLYEKVKSKNPVTTYHLLMKNLPGILEILSVYNVRFFSMELTSENPF